MARVIVDFTMIDDPINMMQTLLREVEKLCIEKNKNSEALKQEILDAPSIPTIESIIEREFGDELKIRDKYTGKTFS